MNAATGRGTAGTRGAGAAPSEAAVDPALGVVARIRRFVETAPQRRNEGAAAAGDELDELALETIRFQATRVPAYRRLLDARGCRPEALRHWSEAPAAPTAAFKTADLCAAPARIVFRSSGTLRGPERRSVHRHPFPDLYRLVIDRTFPAACLPAGVVRPAMLSLVPPGSAAPDSSLSFMIDHVVLRWGGPRSEWAMTRRGLDAARARDWLARAVSRGEPVVVLATALALDELLRSLETADARYPAPPGSVLFETGGFKGRRRETTRDELLARAFERLAIPPERVVREYGMTELTSQAYTRALAGGDPDVFFGPPWLRASVVDPSTLAELPRGETGMLRLFDLANVGSVSFLLTEDLARAETGGGFRLVGRAAGAELRGCSLIAEELAEAGAAAP